MTLRVSELRPLARQAESWPGRFIGATAACRIERHAAVTGIAETLSRFSELAASPLGSNPEGGGWKDYAFGVVAVVLEGFRLRICGFESCGGGK